MPVRTHIVPNTDILIRTRILAGLNKLDLAKAAGIPHSSIVRMERGGGVSPKTATSISRALGQPFDTLFSIQGPAGNCKAAQGEKEDDTE
ncbi:helix-turn-helix transcriptional regulator [Oscillospiraceae bacterium 44-5]|nr:helix-turn-helix domain-containing protein [Oscillospiraceae bacterium]